MAALATLLLALLPTPASAGATVSDLLCLNGGAEVRLSTDVTEAVLTVNCTATLDLNGNELTVQRVVLGAGADLTIKDSAGGGELIANATGAPDEAGISTTGATLRIESGTVTATGGLHGAGIGGGRRLAGGSVTISGGVVVAIGGNYGAGIGGGELGAGGEVTISGGTVTAEGGDLAAGIGGGGGKDGASVTISGGEVMARGGYSGAGIGGGKRGTGGSVTISGGTVTAEGGDLSAGIGGGDEGAGGSVAISGGSVTAIGGNRGAGIGGGDEGAGGSVTIAGGTVTATAGSVWAAPIGQGAFGIPGTVTVDPSAIDTTSTDELIRSISFPVPPVPPVQVSSIRVVCGPEATSIAATVVCTVSGGDPGIDILWRAAYNPVFAEAGVTLDDAGAGEFAFVVPASALGEELTVELVEWTAPMSLGVVGGPVPTSVPSGEGPMTVWPLTFLLLVGALVVRSRPRGASDALRRGW